MDSQENIPDLAREARARIAPPLTSEALRLGSTRKIGVGLPLIVNKMPLPKQILLAALTVGLLSFIIFIEFIATKSQLRFIGANHLDKIAHLTGGVFLAMLFEWLAPRRYLPLLLLFISVAAVTWEGYEFFFDADTAYFYRHLPDLWRLDMAGDIAAAYLGGYSYWVFSRPRG